MCVFVEIGTRPKISRDKLESTLITSNHPSGSSDLAVLERYFKPLCEGRLEPDAVVYYGRLLERTDVHFIPAFVDAITPMVESDPTLLEKLQLRFGDTFHQLQQRCKSIRDSYANARKGVADELQKLYADVDFAQMDKFAHQLARLDS